MSFRAKRIFLAEDDPKERESIKKALLEAGHTIVLEAETGVKALSLINEAVSRQVEVAVLDGNMPNEGDGEKVAEELNSKLQDLIVVSVSSTPLDIWKDPNFDETKPYHLDLPSHDVNGRQKFRRADIAAHHVDWDYKKLAQLIGEIEFSLPVEKELRELPDYLEFVQRSRGESR